jgi:hypothetical protein
VRGAALALACALAVLPAAVADAAKRKVPRGFYGTVYSGNIELAPKSLQTQLWNNLAQGGVESARVVFNWDLAQGTPNGAIKWSRIDRLVTNAVKRGMSVLPVVEYAPNWAKQYPGQVASPPKQPSDYTAFLRACIERYGPNGTFWGKHPELPNKPLREWEVWNEPEIIFHWYRQPRGRAWGKSDAKRYVKLLRASYKAVHDADPGAKVVLAALSIDSWKNLKKLYDWTDIEGQFDVAAIQAYSGTTAFIPTLMRRFRSALDTHGASGVPIYVTEMTWPAAKGKAHPHYTTGYMAGFLTDNNGAAARLTEGYKILRGMRSELKLKRVYWYTGVSAYSGPNEFEYSGLLTVKNGGPAAWPSYFAYQKSAKAAEGCAKTPTGDCQ